MKIYWIYNKTFYLRALGWGFLTIAIKPNHFQFSFSIINSLNNISVHLLLLWLCGTMLHSFSWVSPAGCTIIWLYTHNKELVNHILISRCRHRLIDWESSRKKRTWLFLDRREEVEQRGNPYCHRWWNPFRGDVYENTDSSRPTVRYGAGLQTNLNDVLWKRNYFAANPYSERYNLSIFTEYTP